MFNISKEAKLDTVRWDAYKQAAFNGQIASGILLVIAAVALAVIFATHPHGTYVANNYPAIFTLGALGGASFVVFAGCSYLHYYGLRKFKRDRENQNFLNQFQQQLTTEPNQANGSNSNPIEPLSVAAAQPLEQIEDPVNYIRTTVIAPLLKAFEGAVQALATANGMVMSHNIKAKIEKIKWAFKEGNALFDVFLNNPQMYVSELLRYFGPGKNPLSVALRRLIAAHNSGDRSKYQEMLEEYETILQGHNFSEIEQALKNQSPEQLMASLPDLIAPRFSLPDPELKQLGIQVLNQIFANAKNNKEVLAELTKLKKNMKSDTLFEQVAQFVEYVHQNAQITQEQYKEWNTFLTKHMLTTTFKNTIRLFLGMAERNIRILNLMFDTKTAQSDLFITLDTTFLLSESCDCIKNEKNEMLQAKIYKVQSMINAKRDKKIALIILDQSNSKNYQQLAKELKVMKHCLESANIKESDLQAINANENVKKICDEFSIRLVAVPAAFADHPFKMIREKQQNSLVKAGVAVAGALKLNGLVKQVLKILSDVARPKLLELLPNMEGENKKRFDKLFETLLNLFIDPIYDGAIADTKFRPIFETVITTKGTEFANILKELLKKDELSYEEITQAWITSVNGIAEAFMHAANSVKK